jgi:molecular chaperone DnaK (HSP70)
MTVSESQQGIFGIDLGTTYSVVGYIDETGRPAVTRNSNGDDTTPSVVFFENENNVVVGKVAKESAGVFPAQVISLIKREMGNKDYTRTFFGKEFTPSSISAIILGALAKDAEGATHRAVNEAVVTVPAYFGLLEKDATKKAGEIAGLKVIGIVPEPVAAAMHYGVTGSADGTTFLVYDLGGGTFDISLIRMTEDSIEVLAVGGDHMLGGADWDKELFDHIVQQTIEQTGDDSIEDDEGVLQELRLLAESTKQALSKAESKTIIHRQTGTAVKIVVTRKQFEEMTADLLEETIRITSRTLEDAEKRYPGVRGQISEFLLVGGSSWMPVVAERLKQEFRWTPKLADPDLAVAKGAALYAAGQTVRYVESGSDDGQTAPGTATEGGRSASLPPGPVSAEAVRELAGRTGLDEEQIESFAKRTVVNVLPKAVGIKLVDSSKPDWEADPEAASYIEHLVAAQTQLSYQAEKFTASTAFANQQSIEIEIWEQSGAVPAPELSANHRVDDAGLIEGLGPFALPKGSPVDITIGVDAEGTVSLVAVEPKSGKELTMSVKISIMSEEKMAEAKANFSGLALST